MRQLLLDKDAILRQTPSYLIIYDTDLKVAWVNRYYPEFGPETVIGKGVADLVHAEDSANIIAQMRSCLGLGQTWTGRLRDMNGAVFDYRMGPLWRAQDIVGVIVSAWEQNAQQKAGDLFLLSPLTRQVVEFLSNKEEPAKGSVIGKHVGQISGKQASSTLRVLLADLEARGIVVRTSGGYTLSGNFRSHFVGKLSY